MPATARPVFRFLSDDPAAVQREIAAEGLECAAWGDPSRGLVWIAAAREVAAYAVLKWAASLPARCVASLRGGVPVYRRIADQPPGLVTKSWLAKRRMRLRPNTGPAAYRRGRKLYRVADAEPIPPKVPIDYDAIFAARYPSKRAALLDVCAAMFELNHYAQHPDCPMSEIAYGLKHRLVRWLYEHGFCVEAGTVTQPRYCWECGGTGRLMDWRCDACGGTGHDDYVLWGFRFEVDGRRFAWHVPEHHLGGFEPQVIGDPQPHVVSGKPKRVSLSRSELLDALRLVRWFLKPDVPAAA